MTKIIKNNIVLICLVSLFMFFNFKFGVKYVEDSQGYIEGYRTRSVLYPFLLQISSIIDKGNYSFLILFQNILGLISIYILSDYYSNKFKHKLIIEKCITALFLLMPWIYFLYGEHIWITNVILTEGVTYSVFYLFIFTLQKYIDDKDNKGYIFSVLLATLLVLIRIQFVYLYLIIFFVMLLKKGKFSKNTLKVYLPSVIIMAACIVLIFAGKQLYFMYFPIESEEITHYDCNLVENFVGITEGDVGLIESYDKELYGKIYNGLNENDGLFCQYKEKYILPQISYKYSGEYDRLSFEVIKPILLDSVEELVAENGLDSDEAVYCVKASLKRIESQCLHDYLITYLEVYVLRIFEGFGRMVSAGGAYAWIIAVVLYLIMGVFVLLNRYDKNMMYTGLLFVALSTMNCFVVCVMIDPSDRYVIYGMGLFYIYLWFLFIEIIRKYNDSIIKKIWRNS